MTSLKISTSVNTSITMEMTCRDTLKISPPVDHVNAEDFALVKPGNSFCICIYLFFAFSNEVLNVH